MTSMPIDLAEFATDLEKASAESEPSDESLLRQFSVHGDPRAFEQLVVRHGPMVLGVCRRMLRDSHAADDAFQATFLVLVRRATSLRQPELLGNWLYGVAYRIAARAGLQSVRRANHELRFSTILSVWNVADATLPPQSMAVRSTGSESPNGTSMPDGTSMPSSQVTQGIEADFAAAACAGRRCGSGKKE